MTLDEIRAFFGGDDYATAQTGIEILDGGRQKAICRLRLEKRHANGYGFVMGGVMFTLADFTFAIASNTEQDETVTLSASIQYHSSAKIGQTLISEAKCLHDGGKTSAYEIEIRNAETGKRIATASFTGCKTGRKGVSSPANQE